ncbi:MAG: hypothetical protein WDN28_07710 [Chthoniobacter sp.]
MRYFCHASEGLHWREATQEDKDEVQNAARASKSGEKPKTKEDLKALIPKQGWIAKNALLSLASTAGIGGQQGTHVYRSASHGSGSL